ncbi:MAG: XdhC family protein [Solirubrobacterales bacterium]
MALAGALPSPPVVASHWLGEGRRVVATTLVDRIGSAPLDPGAEMLVDADGNIEGTVTGGCVESSLVDEAREVLGGGAPRVVEYGVSDQQAADVGLMCGGTVRVLVHELGETARGPLAAVAAAVEDGAPAALATLIDGEHAGAQLAVLADGTTVGGLGLGLLDHAVQREALGFLDEGLSALRRYGSGGEVMGDELGVLIQSFATPPEMAIFGAIDFSAALARIAREAGYRVTICDAREPFARSERFAEAAEVVVDWPDRYLSTRRLGLRDAILVFTHDPKFDQPALTAALASGAGYVGALGSRRTQAERAERLRRAGVPAEEIARIHAPCGLDVGARTPAETAVSILAEVIAVRTGRSGVSLRASRGPIHPD